MDFVNNGCIIIVSVSYLKKKLKNENVGHCRTNVLCLFICKKHGAFELNPNAYFIA